MLLYTLLILLPLVMSVVIFKVNYCALQKVMLLFAGIMSVIATLLFLNPVSTTLTFGSFLHVLFILIDVILIGYFLKEGLKFKSSKVWILALTQLILFVLAESMIEGKSVDLVIDELACFMFIVINIVGSLIVVYAVWYIDKEDMSEERKRVFLLYLTLFLVVMNLIVVANSLMLFFLFFEVTTLASYLLISFRKDEIGQNNALRALWMNQIGGVFILSAVIMGAQNGIPAYFSSFLQEPVLILVVALLALAGLIKGAQTPFDSWLLGAMVAPTPVSAILHSATMVKIAPFVVLKLSSGLQGTVAGELIVVFGSFVFVIAGLYGLAREKFKEILGYSTISLLGLMCAMAVAMGSENPTVVYILIFFHAVSKALLFLLAGILEKNHHVKEISGMDGLLHKAPLSAAMVIFGFGTITLPPFGLFFGKLFSIEEAASMIAKSPAYLVLIIGLALGSAILTLLYFKVASSMFSKRADIERYAYENKFDIAMITPYIYSVILLGSVWFILEGGIQVPIIYAYLALGMIALVPLWAKVSSFVGVDRVKEYYCGEQDHFSTAQWFFEISKSTQTKITLFGIVCFIAIAVAGGVL